MRLSFKGLHLVLRLRGQGHMHVAQCAFGRMHRMLGMEERFHVRDCVTCDYVFAACTCPVLPHGFDDYDRHEGIALLQENNALTYRCRGPQGPMNMIPVVQNSTVSCALSGTAFFVPGGDYVFEIIDFDGNVCQECHFSGPSIGELLVESIQYGPVSLLAQISDRSTETPRNKLVQLALQELVRDPSVVPTLLCVSSAGASVLECDRDVALLPSSVTIVVLLPGMSDSLVAYAVEALPSVAALAPLLEWVKAHGGIIGTETEAAVEGLKKRK
jgi:hypothetical protein